MKKGLLFFLLSVCFFIPSSFATEQYNFIHINGVNGLSNSHVKSIIQDSYGFIWLGTRNGLNRYDGVSMQVYPCFDEVSGHGNQVIYMKTTGANFGWERTTESIFRTYRPESSPFLMQRLTRANKSAGNGWKIFCPILPAIYG